MYIYCPRRRYDAQPPRVLIEDEANYENLKYSSMTTNVPGWLARQSAWQSQIAGAAGYTYGADTCLFSAFYTKTRRFAKTGSGQTGGTKGGKKKCLCRRPRHLVGLLQPQLCERKLRPERSARHAGCEERLLYLGPMP